jgi:hypothetical protein
MNRMIVRSRVGADGVLRLTVPVGKEEADREVQVVVEPVGPKEPMTQEEWAAWVESMAGSITDPTFERPPQGEFEVREEMP